MRSHVRHKIIIVILLFASIGAAHATNPDCEDLMVTATGPLQALKENLPALMSRLKPVYVSKAFDVRILSRSVSPVSFSAEKLKALTVSEIEALQSDYRDLGFTFKSFLQVLVEAHPHASGLLKSSSIFGVTWQNSAFESPWVGHAIGAVGIPGLFGKRKPFFGRLEKAGFQRIPSVLFLPAFSKNDHSVQSRFALAHELAHETQNPESHSDMMWQEARADFLAYLTTGETDAVVASGVVVERMNPNGTTYFERVTKIRSLAEPSVRKPSESMPSLDLHHFNSQIISSALFELTQRLGRPKMIEFVHWMDRQEGVAALPDLTVDSENLEGVKSAIAGQLIKIGALLRTWGDESLDASSRQMLEAVLSQREI